MKLVNPVSKSACPQRDLCIILIFYFTILGFGNWLLSIILDSNEAEFQGRAFFRCATFALLVYLCIKQFCLTSKDIANIVGVLSLRKFWLAINLGLILFLFFLGYEGIEGWTLSKIGSGLISSQFLFDPTTNLYWTSPDFYFLIDVLVATFAAPMAEEFFFRGLLFPSFSKVMNLHNAALLSSAIFVLAHGQEPYFVHTFIFSLFMTYSYAAFRSLGLCVIAHGLYNFAALNSEFFLKGWIHYPLREEEFLNVPYFQLALFLGSALILANWLRKFHLAIAKK